MREGMDTLQEPANNNNTSKENPSLLSNGGPKPKQESPRSLATAATTVMAASDRLKRDEWSEGAVSSLLEAYEAKWVLRNRDKLKGKDWDDVARHVSARGNSTKSPKTQTQCKNKIESMKKRYRSESATAADASARRGRSILASISSSTGISLSSASTASFSPATASSAATATAAAFSSAVAHFKRR